jgi:hypothetical protein
MPATKSIAPRLETRGPADVSLRQAITVRTAALTQRLIAEQELKQRRDAFVALFANAPRKPDALYELTRAEPRSVVIGDEKQRRLIHEGICAGYITREQVIRYRASQVRDDLAQFADARQADDTLFCALMTEAGEMVEAQVVARSMPTSSNVERAVRETDEAIAVAMVYVESQRVSA